VSCTDLIDNYPVQLQKVVPLMLSITILGCRIRLEPEVNGILDEINDAVKPVESTEKKHNGDCLVRQTVKEIQAGNFKKITSHLYDCACMRRGLSGYEAIACAHAYVHT